MPAVDDVVQEGGEKTTSIDNEDNQEKKIEDEIDKIVGQMADEEKRRQQEDQLIGAIWGEVSVSFYRILALFSITYSFSLPWVLMDWERGTGEIDSGDTSVGLCGEEGIMSRRTS